MTQYTKLTLAAAGIAVAMAGSTSAIAQSADALIDKLVDKGVLTVKEANDLREETDKNFTQAYSVKSGMPEWVTALKFNGDFRGRYEGFYGENENFDDRSRFRYRARFGITAVLQDNLELGFRLASGEVNGDPLSTNQSLQDNGSKKPIIIDLAYGKWMAMNRPGWSLITTVGKMENPFKFSDLVFDSDYTPEGGAVQLGCNLSDAHALALNSGAFLLDELGTSSKDPFLVGVQARLESKWSPKLSTSAGLAYLAIANPESLVNGAVPNGNTGNTRAGATGVLVNDYTPIVADLAATYSLDSFPMYPGAFPIKVGGDYITNPGVDTSTEDSGWSAGVTFGKASKKGTWELGYTYKWLGADAWYEEMVDSDTGAYYAGVPYNSGKTAGYFAGTNVKGHVVKLAYAPWDSVTLSAKVFFTQLIDTGADTFGPAVPADTQSDMTRLQVDALWKF